MPQISLASSLGTSLLMLGLALMIGGMLALGAVSYTHLTLPTKA